MRKGVPNDPLRKERIARAALDLIADEGQRAVTHRRVAARAGVPLGSVTYHFATIDDVLIAAFSLMQTQIDARFDFSAITRDQARSLVIDSVCGDTRASDQELVLYREMYAYGTRSEAVAEMVRGFQRTWISALAEHFGEDAARALDAQLEGWTVYRSWNPDGLDRDLVVRAVDAVLDALPRPEPTQENPR